MGAQVIAEQERIGGGHPFAAEGFRSRPSRIVGHGDRQSATTEVEGAQHFEARGVTTRCHLEAFFFDDVEADKAKITDVFFDEIGDIVVAYEQQIERHVLAKPHQLVLTAGKLEPTAHQ